MTSRFIVALWDDQDRWREKVHAELKRSELNRRGRGPSGHAMLREIGAVAYCFGDACEAMARDYGLATVRLKDTRLYRYPNGYLCRKFQAMQAALVDFDEVLLLDVDMILQNDLPADFWDRVGGRQPIRAPLQAHKNRKCRWRPLDGRRFWASAAFMYCRDRRIAGRLIDLMDKHPHFMDEHALCYCIDQRMGGWRDHQAWIDEGYHLPCVWLRSIVQGDDAPPFVHGQEKAGDAIARMAG